MMGIKPVWLLTCDHCGKTGVVDVSGTTDMVPKKIAAEIGRESGWKYYHKKLHCPECCGKEKK